MTQNIAVLIPCHNEAAAIRKVVQDFQAALPDATIYVYDNNSTDGTSGVAAAAGAVVRAEPMQGKGHVVRRMFADIEADIYLLVDGDDTYDAATAPGLVSALVDGQLDMVNAARLPDRAGTQRFGHAFGNRLLTGLVRRIFGARLQDMLSGYKVLSRRFVKSFPCLATGFEIETEIAVHALELRMPILEQATGYRDRPAGSASKLHTIRDGVRILWTILRLVQVERPLQFFGTVCLVLLATAIWLMIPVFETFEQTGLVPRFPTALLATGMTLLGFLSLVCGLVLQTVTLGRLEAKRMIYLGIPAIRRTVGKPAKQLPTDSASLDQ
ncbi:MAG: glycosyltransferase family 2 protein [Aliidongia sp.]